MSTTTIALSAGATLVALAFAGSTYERWLARRRRHELAWSVALLFFALGSLGLFAGAGLGWGGATFRWFYLFGAILNVPVLALGSVYLLAGPATGDRWAVIIAVASGFAVGVVVSAPLTGAIDPGGLPQGSEVFGPVPRILAALASGVGATVVFVGAVWSAVRLLRGRRRPGGSASPIPPGRLASGNLLIALAVVILSASGLLNSVLGEMQAFAVTLTAGVVVLFTGFLVAATPARPAHPTAGATGDDDAGAGPNGPGTAAAAGPDTRPTLRAVHDG